MRVRRAAFALLCSSGLWLALGACSSEPEPAKTPEQVRSEQAAARDQAKQGVYGTQIKSLDKAAAVQGTVDEQAQATKDAVEQQTDSASAEPAAPATTPP